MYYFKLLSTLLFVILLNSCGKKNGLEVNNDEEIKIVQRGSKAIKGSEGDIDLKISDITNGLTDVVIEGIENGKVYFKKKLSEAGEGYFQYGKNYYRIKINHFEEHLLHDDYAFISFRAVSEANGKAKLDVIEMEKETKISPDEIKNYLNKIKTSGLKFIRNGEIWTDLEMFAHLENKYLINLRDIKTKEDFIDKIVSGSSLTGETYKVISNKNDTISLTNWLNL